MNLRAADKLRVGLHQECTILMNPCASLQRWVQWSVRASLVIPSGFLFGRNMACLSAALTLGRFHFSQSMQALEIGRTDRASKQMAQVFKDNPQFDDDADYLLRITVQCAFELGLIGTLWAKSTWHVRAVFCFIHDLFGLLPGGLNLLRAKWKWASAELYVLHTFATFEAGG